MSRQGRELKATDENENIVNKGTNVMTCRGTRVLSKTHMSASGGRLNYERESLKYLLLYACLKKIQLRIFTNK